MYLAEFQRLHNLSGITDNKTLISCMRNGVTPELRTRISIHLDIHKSYTFDEYMALCKDCVIRLELERPTYSEPSNPTPSRGKNQTPQGNYSTPSRGANPNPPRYAPKSNELASGANGVPLGGDPMDLDQSEMSHIGPDGHITPEERQRRF
ncbi:hypothetical protein K3495_g14360 [Podosphaera aphanis]|nr:hypothetical protein K3495_g14360 [Podosphaera aphanis]